MVESRFRASYRAQDGQTEEQLVDYARQLQPAGRSEEWVLGAEDVDYLDWEWGSTEARGNVRVRLSFETRWCMATVGQLEAAIDAHKLAMVAHREGYLTLESGWHMNAPLLITRWRATLTGIAGGLIDTDEDMPTPYNPGGEDPLKGRAVGFMRYEFALSRPEKIKE